MDYQQQNQFRYSRMFPPGSMAANRRPGQWSLRLGNCYSYLPAGRLGSQNVLQGLRGIRLWCMGFHRRHRHHSSGSVRSRCFRAIWSLVLDQRRIRSRSSMDSLYLDFLRRVRNRLSLRRHVLPAPPTNLPVLHPG